jgi:hypothetical protein
MRHAVAYDYRGAVDHRDRVDYGWSGIRAGKGRALEGARPSGRILLLVAHEVHSFLSLQSVGPPQG